MEFTSGIYHSWQRTQEKKYKHMKEQLGELFDEVFSGAILDIGCGFGYLEKMLEGTKAYDAKVPFASVSLFVGVDNSVEMLKNQVAIFPRVLADGGNLPFKSNSFDSIISIDAMHLIRGSDFIRVLKPGGSILMSIFFNDQNYEQKKELLLGKLMPKDAEQTDAKSVVHSASVSLDIVRDFSIHGREKEYVVVARKGL